MGKFFIEITDITLLNCIGYGKELVVFLIMKLSYVATISHSRGVWSSA